jgi:chromosome segregation ATPase
MSSTGQTRVRSSEYLRALYETTVKTTDKLNAELEQVDGTSEELWRAAKSANVDQVDINELRLQLRQAASDRSALQAQLSTLAEQQHLILKQLERTQKAEEDRGAVKATLDEIGPPSKLTRQTGGEQTFPHQAPVLVRTDSNVMEHGQLLRAPRSEQKAEKKLESPKSAPETKKRTGYKRKKPFAGSLERGGFEDAPLPSISIE